MRYIALILLPAIFMLICTTLIAIDGTNSPVSGFDLTKLRKFYDAKKQDVDKARQELIVYLREELEHPSSPRMGIGGGPIDTVYIQDVIISVMAQTIPAESLSRGLGQERDKRIKDRIMIALLAAGDQTFINDVQSLLQTTNDNLIRLAAVRAMRNAPKKDLESVLPIMRDDTYSRIVFHNGAYRKVYPIRQSAHEALTRSGVPVEGWSLETCLTKKWQYYQDHGRRE